MSDAVNDDNRSGSNPKGKWILLSYMVFMLVMAIVMPHLFKSLDRSLNDDRMQNYENALLVINDWEDSPEKEDFIAYTTKVIASEDPTYPQKIAVEAKLGLLGAVRQSKDTKRTVNTDSYEKYINKAKDLPKNTERENFIQNTTDLIADGKLSEIDEARIEAQYRTLLANQNYRQVTIKSKIKEWWQSW